MATDYNKLTVVDIRALFKDRGIPATGLTRKQQLIDRLLEADAQEAAPVEPTTSATSEDRVEDQQVNETTVPADTPITQSAGTPATESVPETAVTASNETEGIESTQDAIPDVEPPVQNEASAEPDSMTLDSQTAVSEGLPVEQSVLSRSAEPISSSPVDESRKRKRRSPSPSVGALDIAQKRMKQSDGIATVHLTEDFKDNGKEAITPKDVPISGVANEASSKEDDTEVSEQEELSSSGRRNEEDVENRMDEDDKGAQHDAIERKAPSASLAEPQLTDKHRADLAEHEPPGLTEQTQNESTRHNQGSKDVRYKGLFSVDGANDRSGAALDRVEGDDNDEEEREVGPSLHSATAALYIRDIMRPLQPATLRDHLIALAQPKKTVSEESHSGDAILKEFHLDAIRTHCFAVFTSVSAASRVRSALHQRIWPSERTRKPLWVDFVPEEKVFSWIDIELDAGGNNARGPGAKKRWEIVYETLEDGSIETTLQESDVGSHSLPLSNSNRGFGTGDSSRPMDIDRIPPTSHNMKPAPAPQQPSFMALDSLFQSTKSKPKLYFLPVTRELANRRLDELDAKTSRRNLIPPGGSGLPDSKRYTFENEQLVDNGPEFGLRRESGNLYRGRGGYRGGGRRGR